MGLRPRLQSRKAGGPYPSPPQGPACSPLGKSLPCHFSQSPPPKGFPRNLPFLGRKGGEELRVGPVSAVAVGVPEASSCSQTDRLSNDSGSPRPGRMVCEPGAMTHSGFVHLPRHEGKAAIILSFPAAGCLRVDTVSRQSDPFFMCEQNFKKQWEMRN